MSGNISGESAMIKAARRLILLTLAILASGPVAAQFLSTVETDKLRLLYFDPTETYLVPRVIQTFHNSADRQKSIFGYETDEKTTLLLIDFSDFGNASASSIPYNTLIVDIAPISLAFETAAPAERMYTIMNHELVHISTTDQTAPADERARRFFRGKVAATAEHPETILYQYLTAPRKTSPRWYLEGMAVFMETWLAGGLGRAQGYFDEMVFRAMVRDGAQFYNPLSLVSEGARVDFQAGTNAYLYGTRFITYLAYTYSPEKVVEWARRDEGSRRSYEEEFDRVFGKRLNDAWQDWVEFETQFQKDNLQSVREYSTTPYEELAPEALGSVSRTFHDEKTDSLIAAVQYPGIVAHLASLSIADGSVEQLEEIKGPSIYQVASVAWDPDSRTVFYTADNYDYRDLVAFNLDTGKSEVLQKDARIGELVFNRSDRSLWGIRHLNGTTALVRIPPPYTEWNMIETFPYGTVPYDMDISPDGKLLSTSVGNIEGKHSLQVHSVDALLKRDFEAITTFDFGDTIPEGFVFSKDGRYLFGSSFYTGVSNIFRFEIETGALEAVSNAETGFFRPLPIDNETLFAYTFTGEGFLPVRIHAEPLEDVSAISVLGAKTVQRHPILKTWKAGSPDDVKAEERIVSEGHYKASKNLGLESIYPVMLGYKDSLSLGLKANFSDPIRLDTLSIGAAYSTDSDLPSDERPNFTIDYKHAVISTSPLSGSWLFSAALNGADFYDLAGPTEHSRKGNRFTIGYDKTLMSDGPRSLALDMNINHYSDMDALPRYQNIPTTFDKLSVFNASLEYSNRRSSIGAVDSEKGYRWLLGTSVSHVDGDTIPQYLGEFDFGFALPWKHSSIWIRNSLGGSDGDILDEFANFYFGGFGNNYVDRGTIKRYRDWYSMPGFDLNQVSGQTFHKAMLEWNLPPILFSKVGTPGFYLTWARPSIFFNSLTTNIDDSALRDEVTSAGIQVDFRFTILSRMKMTLSLGYAKGFGNSSIMDDDEFMASLKIL
jgi:sugar lactone lactonase YvrE